MKARHGTAIPGASTMARPATITCGIFMARSSALGLVHCNSGNTSVFGRLHMSSKYWIDSGLPQAPMLPAEQSALKEYLRATRSA